MTKETKEDTCKPAILIVVDTKRNLATCIFNRQRDVVIIPYEELIITGEIQKK